MSKRWPAPRPRLRGARDGPGDTLDWARRIAELPELVRGYEEIKLAGVEAFRARGAELLAERATVA